MNVEVGERIKDQVSAGNLIIRFLLVMPIATAVCGFALLSYQMAFAGFAASAIVAGIAAYFWQRDGATGWMPSLAALSLATQLAVMIIMFLPFKASATGLFGTAHSLFFVGLAITAAWSDTAAILVFYAVALLWVAMSCALLPPGFALGAGSLARLAAIFALLTLLTAALILLIRRTPRRFPDQATAPSIEEAAFDP